MRLPFSLFPSVPSLFSLPFSAITPLFSLSPPCFLAPSFPRTHFSSLRLSPVRAGSSSKGRQNEVADLGALLGAVMTDQLCRLFSRTRAGQLCTGRVESLGLPKVGRLWLPRPIDSHFGQDRTTAQIRPRIHLVWHPVSLTAHLEEGPLLIGRASSLHAERP